MPVSLLVLVLATIMLGFLALRRRSAGTPHSALRTSHSALPDSPSTEEQALLQAVASARPHDPGPARRLGDFYASAGRPFGALWAYAIALHAAPGDPSTRRGLARALEMALLFDQAVDQWRRVLEREPADEVARTSLAELYLRTGRPEAALVVVSAPSRGRESAAIPLARSGKPPQPPNNGGSRGRDLLGSPHYWGAGGAAPERALLEGRVREAMGDFTGAERAYRHATQMDPREAAAWHRWGLLALSQGKRADARQALERSRALDPTEPRYGVDLGRAVAAGGTPGDTQAAMAPFREVAAAHPYGPAFYEAGRILAAQGRLPEAAGAFLRATKADRDDVRAYGELARILERSGRRAEAHYQRGLYQSARDLRACSLREYLAMAAADPSRPTGLLLASQAHFKMQQNARAVDVARRAYQRFPHDREVREQLAALAILAARREEAAALCRAWLREEPDAAQPLWMLGRIAADSLRFDESFGYYERALEKQPENPAFLQSFGQALLDAPGEAHVARAVTVLSRAVAAAPEDAQSRHALGTALMRAGRTQEALRQMLRSLDLDPHHGPTYSIVVQLARRLRQPGPVALFGPMVRAVEGRLRTELALWRRTWDHPDDPDGYLALARYLIRTADLRKAQSQLEEALRLRPDWPEAESLLARVRRLRVVTE